MRLPSLNIASFPRYGKAIAMNTTTLSIIKADIGSIGGHVAPSKALMHTVDRTIADAQGDLISDYFLGASGDDILCVCLLSKGSAKDRSQPVPRFPPWIAPPGHAIREGGNSPYQTDSESGPDISGRHAIALLRESGIHGFRKEETGSSTKRLPCLFSRRESSFASHRMNR